MRKLLFLLLLVFAGYVGYMYFFGQGDDKANARVIVGETKELANAVTNFLSHQKRKYDDAEFEKLIQKIDTGIDSIRNHTLFTEPPYSMQLRDMLIELKKLDPSKLSPENQMKLEKTKKELKYMLGIPEDEE
jgi:hypothetical protein